MAIAFVQGTGNLVTSTNTPPTKAFASNVTAGNLLCVALIVQGASATCTTMSVSDTLANTWIPVFGAIQSPSGGTINKFIQAWYCLTASGGANIITPADNATGVGQGTLGIAEFSGFSGLATLDQKGALAISSPGTQSPVLSLTTTIPNSVIYALAEINIGAGSYSGSANAPFTTINNWVAGQNNSVNMYDLVPATGTYSAQATWTSTANNSGFIVGFSISTQTALLGNMLLAGMG